MSEIQILDDFHWHKLRQNNIGSSDAATLFNHNKWQSPYALYCVKHGLVSASDSGNSRSEWGKRFEAPIACGLAEDNGWNIRKCGYYQHSTIKGMGCTPDFIIKSSEILEDMGYFGAGVFEIKNLEHWGYFAEFTKEEANHYIEVQIQHQLSCTDLRWAALGYKLPGQTPAVQFKFRDDDFIKTLEKRVGDFWSSTKPPAPDHSDSDSKIVRDLYVRQQGKEFIDMSTNNQLPELVATLQTMKDQKKPLNAQIASIEKVEKGIKNTILSMSQGAEIIKFQGGEIKINTVNRGAVAPCGFQTVNYSLDKEDA